MLLADQAGRDAFETIDQLGNRDCRWVEDQSVHMIPLTVEFRQGGFEVLAYVRKDRPQVLQDFLSQASYSQSGYARIRHVSQQNVIHRRRLPCQVQLVAAKAIHMGRPVGT